MLIKIIHKTRKDAGYYSGTYIDKTYKYTSKAQIDVSNHCPVVSEKLSHIAASNSSRVVGTIETDDRYKKQSNLKSIQFQSVFRETLSELNQAPIISAEIAYIKKLPTYNSFIQSSFWKDFQNNFNNHYAIVKNAISYVVSYPEQNKNTNTSKLTSYFVLRHNCPSDGDDVIHIPSITFQQYRALSYTEMSMFAIALSETYPQFFTLVWCYSPEFCKNIGLFYSTSLYDIIAYFSPVFNPTKREIAPGSKYRDIY